MHVFERRERTQEEGAQAEKVTTPLSAADLDFCLSPEATY